MTYDDNDTVITSDGIKVRIDFIICFKSFSSSDMYTSRELDLEFDHRDGHSQIQVKKYKGNWRSQEKSCKG